ncbi:MAG: CYTH domain-containing protein [Patescibacteria group bacterium]|jgi:adenylate cyclase class 2
MKTEIEAKFLDIDPGAIRNTLKQIGARCVYSEQLQKRKIFDSPDHHMERVGGCVWVREENGKITLAYKQLNNRTLQGTKEVSVRVDDFDRACEFLLDIGLVLRSYQETRREQWLYQSVEITIDTWPWIPTFLEIEAPTEVEVRKTAAALGLEWERALFGSVEIAYQQNYDVTEQEVDSWPSATFTDIPQDLLKKRKRK